MDSIPVERKQKNDRKCTAGCSRSAAELKLKNCSGSAPGESA